MWSGSCGDGDRGWCQLEGRQMMERTGPAVQSGDVGWRQLRGRLMMERMGPAVQSGDGGWCQRKGPATFCPGIDEPSSFNIVIVII